MRLLRLRHLHRPGPPDGGLRRRLRASSSAGPGPRRACPRPPRSSSGAGPRPGCRPTCWSAILDAVPRRARGRGHRGVQPRGRPPGPAGRLPGRRGDPDLAGGAVDGAPRAGRTGPSSRHRPAPSRRPPAVAEAGFASWNMDLILGGPGETDADWARSLGDVLGLESPPPHLSAYSLHRGAGHAAGRRPGPSPRRRRPGRPVRGGRPRPGRRPATGGRRSPTGPSPATGAGTTASTGSRATTGASGRPPTPTAPGTAVVERPDPRPVRGRHRGRTPCATAGDEVLTDEQRRFEAWPWPSAPRPACPPARLPDRSRSRGPGRPLGRTRPCSPCGDGCWPTRSPPG